MGSSVIRKVCDLQADGLLLVEDGNHGENRPRPSEFEESGVLFIRAADMANGRLLFESAQRINETARARVRRGIGRGCDVILSHKGTVGKVAYVPADAPDFVCSPQTTFWRTLDESQINSRYLYAYLNSTPFRDQLYSRANETDMAGYVSLTAQRQLEVVLPPLPEQKAIAHILGSLDDKIELNRRMNATLEGMAQALFKSWFVDFDPVIDNALAAGNPIPDELAPRACLRASHRQAEVRRHLSSEALAKGEALANGTANRDLSSVASAKGEAAKCFPAAFQQTEAMGWIPEGWEVQQVKDFGSVVCGKTPSKSNPDYYGEDVPFIKIPDMHHSAWITNTSDGLSFAGADSQNKKQIPARSISVSCIATVGKVVITSEPSHTNQQINSVIPSAEQSRYYLYFTFLEKNKELHDLASGGSATLNLNTGSFSKIELLSPPAVALKLYHEATDPLFEKMLASDLESQSLTTLRDTLLPKLISGELQTDDFETLNEEEIA